LVAEAQHEMLEPGGADFSEGILADRPREIDAGDLGAERFADLRDSQASSTITG